MIDMTNIIHQPVTSKGNRRRIAINKNGMENSIRRDPRRSDSHPAEGDETNLRKVIILAIEAACPSVKPRYSFKKVGY
jgi:hypothetical protein